MSIFETNNICKLCGGFKGAFLPPYVRACTCKKEVNNDYMELLRQQLEPPKPTPTIDYDILAEKVAAKVVALLGKKKRRAKR